MSPIALMLMIVPSLPIVVIVTVEQFRRVDLDRLRRSGCYWTYGIDHPEEMNQREFCLCLRRQRALKVVVPGAGPAQKNATSLTNV